MAGDTLGDENDHEPGRHVLDFAHFVPDHRGELLAGGARVSQEIAMPSRSDHKPFYTHLYFQVLVAIAIGVTMGIFFPATATAMKPLGMASSS